MHARELQEDPHPFLRKWALGLLEHLVKTECFAPSWHWESRPKSSHVIALMQLCGDTGSDDLLVHLIERVSSPSFGTEISPSPRDLPTFQLSLVTCCHMAICDIIKIHSTPFVFKDCVLKMRLRLLKLALSPSVALTTPTADVIVTGIRQDGTTAAYEDLCVHCQAFCGQLIEIHDPA